jgi:transposase
VLIHDRTDDQESLVQDTKLFETILGLQTPWSVSRVALETTQERVDVWVEHAADTRWTCPECDAEAPCRDHSEERVWRHLDTCQFQTFLHARIPRVECPQHGVRQVRVPWAEPRSRFTLLMERLVIDLIRQCSTVLGACRLARISWDEAWGVMTRAVARGRHRKVAQPIPYIGVDEKAFRKGHRYHTIVSDLARATVEYVAEERRTESLASYYATLTAAQRDGLQAVAMDMWEPYIRATHTGLPQGDTKIVFDRFHIMREMTRAVDTVRKQEHRAFLRAGDASPLTGTKYLWLFTEASLPARHAEAFAAVQARELKVGRAWAIKEALRTLWTYRSPAAVRRFFTQWYAWATRSRLSPVRRVAATLKRHLDGVLRYVQHPITNGVAEGLNSKIMSIKRKAGGYRNPAHFTTAIYFHCGGLDLYPR